MINWERRIVLRTSGGSKFIGQLEKFGISWSKPFNDDEQVNIKKLAFLRMKNTQKNRNQVNNMSSFQRVGCKWIQNGFQKTWLNPIRSGSLQIHKIRLLISSKLFYETKSTENVRIEAFCILSNVNCKDAFFFERT